MSKKQLPRDITKAARDQERHSRLAALADGRRTRSVRFRPKRGPGSYRRRPKHRGRDHV